jgi:hypothetical protein
MQADAAAQQLLNVSSPEHRSVLQWVVSSLQSRGIRSVDESDIDVLSTSVVAAGATYNISGTLRITLFNPAGVHRSSLAAAAQTLAGRKRVLLDQEASANSIQLGPHAYQAVGNSAAWYDDQQTSGTLLQAVEAGLRNLRPAIARSARSHSSRQLMQSSSGGFTSSLNGSASGMQGALGAQNSTASTNSPEADQTAGYIAALVAIVESLQASSDQLQV